MPLPAPNLASLGPHTASEAGPSPLPSLVVPLARTPFHVVSPDPKALTALILALVERSGLPSAEVARRMGFSRQCLNGYLSGKKANPSLVWITRLAQICGATLRLDWPSFGSDRT